MFKMVLVLLFLLVMSHPAFAKQESLLDQVDHKWDTLDEQYVANWGRWKNIPVHMAYLKGKLSYVGLVLGGTESTFEEAKLYPLKKYGKPSDSGVSGKNKYLAWKLNKGKVLMVLQYLERKGVVIIYTNDP